MTTKTKAAAKQSGAAGEEQKVQITISAPNMQVAEFRIRGTEPLVQHKFSSKAKGVMIGIQEGGETSKKGTKRAPKNFEECYREATYRMKDGGYGIAASGFRAAMISACRMCGFQMTRAKLSVFVLADGQDAQEGTSLVRITKGVPEMDISPARNKDGSCDLRARPKWAPGWEARLRVRYDADQFTAQDVAHLVMRVGMQVGVGEGRPDSKNSAGMGWGLFEIVEG